MKKSACRTHPFTLVEIIAVLIILGILIAVAVPKYFSLVDQSKARAAEGALAEGKSLCSLVYARMALQTATEPTIANLNSNLQSEINNVAGDWTFNFTAANTGITIGVTGKTGTAIAATTANCLWTIPGM